MKFADIALSKHIQSIFRIMYLDNAFQELILSSLFEKLEFKAAPLSYEWQMTMVSRPTIKDAKGRVETHFPVSVSVI